MVRIKISCLCKNLVGYTLQLIKNIEPGFNIYNATDEPHYSVKDLADVIANKTESTIPFRIPLPVAKGLAFPFDVLSKVTGKDWKISSERVKKFCIDTHFLSDKLHKMVFFKNILQNKV